MRISRLALMTPELEALLGEVASNFHQLRRTANRGNAETRYEQGKQLHRASEALPAGGFTPWVQATLKVTIGTAKNYLSLYRWGHANPGAFQRLKGLGPTKLYALSNAPPERIVDLVPTDTFLAPGAPVAQTLDHMAAQRVYALVAQWRNDPVTPPPIGRAVGTAKRQAGHVLKSLRSLMTRRVETKPGVLRAILTKHRTGIDELISELDGDDS